MENTLVIPVKLDKASFTEFAKFNTYEFRKGRIGTAITGIVLAVLAVLAFLFLPNAQLAGGAMLCLAVGLPIGRYQSFHKGVKAQIKANGLEEPKLVYHVTLSPSGVSQRLPDSHMGSPILPWAQIHSAWQTPKAIYLYVNENRALVFPAELIPMSQNKLWAYLEHHLPSEKLHQCKG